MAYLKHLGVACTQMLNALMGGWPDESTSSRAYRQRRKPRWRLVYRLVNAFFFWQDDHCRLSYEAEQRRRHLPPDLRGG